MLTLRKNFNLKSLNINYPSLPEFSKPHVDFEFNVMLTKMTVFDANFSIKYDHLSHKFTDTKKSFKADQLTGFVRYNTNHRDFILEPFALVWFTNVKPDIIPNKDWELIFDLFNKCTRDYLIKYFHLPAVDVISVYSELLEIIEGSSFINLRLKENGYEKILTDGFLNKIDSRFIDLSKYKIVDFFKRKQNKCVLCRIRKKLVPYTPEEEVRQKFVAYLITEIGIPEELINIEVPISKYCIGSKDRVDLLVFNNVNENKPILLIECKSEEIVITEKTFEQIEKYDKYIGAKLCMITNGKELITYKKDSSKKRQLVINNLNYKQILTDVDIQFKPIVKNHWKRTPVEELSNNEVLTSLALYFDKSTFRKIIPDEIKMKMKATVMLIDLLMDETTKLTSLQIGSVKIIKDGGVRKFNYGTSAGFDDFVGNYHYFILEDNNGYNQIISFAIYKFWITHPPTLMIAIDDDQQSHHVLQINLGKHIKYDNDRFTISHSGKITSGRTPIKKEILFDYIKKEANDLIQNDKIFLGSFDFNKPLYWDSKEVKQFMSNIIRYSLIRDRIRRDLKLTNE